MNKKIAIGVGAIIVIALLAGFFMRSKNTAEVKDEMMKPSPEKRRFGTILNSSFLPGYQYGSS